MQRYSAATEAPPIKVEGFGALERLRRTVGSFPTEVGGFKPDFWKMKAMADENRRLKRMYAEMSMQNDLLKEALGKKR